MYMLKSVKLENTHLNIALFCSNMHGSLIGIVLCFEKFRSIMLQNGFLL